MCWGTMLCNLLSISKPVMQCGTKQIVNNYCVYFVVLRAIPDNVQSACFTCAWYIFNRFGAPKCVMFASVCTERTCENVFDIYHGFVEVFVHGPVSRLCFQQDWRSFLKLTCH